MEEKCAVLHFCYLAEEGGVMSSYRYVLGQGHCPSVQTDSSRARLLYVACTNYSEEWNSTLHTHACAELFFITRGHGVFQVRQERFPVAINDLVVVNTSVPHTETSQNGSPLEYIVLGVEGLETLTDLGGCALLHLLGEQEAVTTCLRQMAREIRERQPGCDEVCQKLLEIILLRLLRREDFALGRAPEGPRGSRECDLVRRYIDNHFKENLTLDQLAEMLHINKYHLVSRRIQESKFLLRETDLSLSQIAQILGFSSLSYFSQSFRRLEDTSPLEYRRQRRKRPTE